MKLNYVTIHEGNEINKLVVQYGDQDGFSFSLPIRHDATPEIIAYELIESAKALLRATTAPKL